MKTIDLKPGYVYDMTLNKVKERELPSCISICALEDGYILNRDGSIAVGFEASVFEEDSIDEDEFMSVINAFSLALKRLPLGSVVQKMDLYHEKPFYVSVEEGDFFFKKKMSNHFNEREVLDHTSLLFIRFFAKKLNPITSPLARFNQVFKDLISDSEFEAKKRIIQSSIEEFLSFLPQGMKLRRMRDEENKKLLYQYASHAFDRDPIGFDAGMVVQEDKLVVSGYLKSVRIKSQADEAFYFKKNNLGNGGVTSGFLWPITHFARFPHIISQQIEIINDKKFLKNKDIELDFTSSLKLTVRAREEAGDVYDRFKEVKKEIIENNWQIVKISTNVFVWDERQDVLNERVNHIKGAFGSVGIDAEEEAEKTGATFFSSFPGGCGFFEGIPMPLETAVTHLNFVSPRKGDGAGILLSDRHGRPIYYDPFKYSLDNQHAFVFGPTGSGKSFFNGKMIKDRFYAGHTMIVIDSGGTYRNLFKALGGKYIEYDPERPLALNPFLATMDKGKYKADADKINFLVNFIAKIWKGDLQNNPLSEEEYAILSKSLNSYYKELKEGEIPTLIEFCKWLPSFVTKDKLMANLFKVDNFLLVLEPFTGGIYKDHFNARQEMRVEDDRLICFELEAVKANTKLYPLVVKVLFDYVLELVAKQPDQKKFIDVEEGWTMLDDSSKDYIEAFFRKGRKTNTSIRIITQNIDEIKHSAIAGAMKNNASTSILLYNDKEFVRKEIADFLGLSEFDREKYAALMRKNSYRGGFREVFIKEMDKSAIWRVETSLIEHAILTSRPDERNSINKLIEKRGDIELAVCQWVREILEKEESYGL